MSLSQSKNLVQTSSFQGMLFMSPRKLRVWCFASCLAPLYGLMPVYLWETGCGALKFTLFLESYDVLATAGSDRSWKPQDDWHHFHTLKGDSAAYSDESLNLNIGAAERLKPVSQVGLISLYRQQSGILSELFVDNNL